MAKHAIDPIERQAREVLKLSYSWVIVPDETGAFNSEILEFPGCFAQGDTADEACTNLREAAIGWLQDQLDKGDPIPPPLSRDDLSFFEKALVSRVKRRLCILRNID